MVAYLVAPNSIFWSKHVVEVTQYTPRGLHVFHYVYKAFPKALPLMFLDITRDSKLGRFVLEQPSWLGFSLDHSEFWRKLDAKPISKQNGRSTRDGMGNGRQDKDEDNLLTRSLIPFAFTCKFDIEKRQRRQAIIFKKKNLTYNLQIGECETSNYAYMSV